jgi:hypothetical protein
VIDIEIALLQQLLNIAQRERIAKIPPDGTKDETGFGLPPFEDRRSGYHFAIVSRHQPVTPKVATHPRYSSLYAWRSIGNASYNALEVILKKNFSQGLQFAFNYTWSKSIDISSDAARIGPWAGLGGQVINAWAPNALRAVSDYDLPQQINASWVYNLPYGHGEKFGTNSPGWVNATIRGLATYRPRALDLRLPHERG